MPKKTSDKKLASVRKWRENNLDKKRASERRWRENNPETVREDHRRWRESHREQVRGYNLRRVYGITLAYFESLKRKQNGLCGICQKPCSRHKTLSVDHCHKTGRVRGLLCDKCNRGLGHFHDDFSTLIRAANYLGWRNVPVDDVANNLDEAAAAAPASQSGSAV